LAWSADYFDDFKKYGVLYTCPWRTVSPDNAGLTEQVQQFLATCFLANAHFYFNHMSKKEHFRLAAGSIACI
jgi:hypothetical protein